MDTSPLDVDLDGLDDDEARAHLVALHVEMARLEAALVSATGAFDRRGLHSGDAARTTAGWLCARVDQTRTQCRADVDCARALRGMPHVAAAFASGRLRRIKVDLLIRTCTPEIAAVFAEQEQWLVDQIADLRVCDANRFLWGWHELARQLVGSIDPDQPIDDTAPRVAVNLAQTFEGRYVLDGEMDAEHGTIIRNAIDTEVDDMFRVGVFSADDGLTPAERRGLALVQIVTRKSRPGIRHDAPRPSVEVICDERTLRGEPLRDGDDLRTRVCRYDDGTPLRPAALHRLLCGADVFRLVIGADGEVLDAGKTIRLANRAQRRALTYRHARHCAFPGCEAPTDWCEAHHIDHYDPDPANPRGRTDMDNLVPLCRYHHHRVHEGGYTLTLQPDGKVTVLRPPDHHGHDAAPPPPDHGGARWCRRADRPGSRSSRRAERPNPAPCRSDPPWPTPRSPRPPPMPASRSRATSTR